MTVRQNRVQKFRSFLWDNLCGSRLSASFEDYSGFVHRNDWCRMYRWLRICDLNSPPSLVCSYWYFSQFESTLIAKLAPLPEETSDKTDSTVSRVASSEDLISLTFKSLWQCETPDLCMDKVVPKHVQLAIELITRSKLFEDLDIQVIEVHARSKEDCEKVIHKLEVLRKYHVSEMSTQNGMIKLIWEGPCSSPDQPPILHRGQVQLRNEHQVFVGSQEQAGRDNSARPYLSTLHVWCISKNMYFPLLSILAHSVHLYNEEHREVDSSCTGGRKAYDLRSLVWISLSRHRWSDFEARTFKNSQATASWTTGNSW